jgi:hypothetical protein
LAEEENADQLLNQVARSLMSVERMPAALERADIDEGHKNWAAGLSARHNCT